MLFGKESMNLSFLTKLASEAPACSRLVHDIRQGPGEQAAAAHPAAQPYLVAALHRELGLPTLVVVPTSQEARQFYEQLLIWCDSQSTVLLLPKDGWKARGKTPSTSSSGSRCWPAWPESAVKGNAAREAPSWWPPPPQRRRGHCP